MEAARSPVLMMIRNRLVGIEDFFFSRENFLRTAIFLLTILFGASLFTAIFVLPIRSDFRAQVNETIAMIRSGVFPFNAGFYLLAATFAGFSVDLVRDSTVCICTLALGIRSLQTFDFVKRDLNGYPQLPAVRFFPAFAVIILMVAYCLPPIRGWQDITAFTKFHDSSRMLLGLCPLNVWHNATYFLMVPFALALFIRSSQWLHGEKNVGLPSILVLSLINILVKPSFFFVFASLFPIFAFIRFGLSKRFFLAVIVILISSTVLLAETRSIFFTDRCLEYGRSPNCVNAGVKLAWMHVWSKRPTGPMYSLLVSYTYPLILFMLFPKELWRDFSFRYAGATVVAATLIYAAFTETGPRESHGNFGWQIHICSYIFFLSCLKIHFRLFIENKERNCKWQRAYVAFAVLLLHFASGIVYLYNFVNLRKA